MSKPMFLEAAAMPPVLPELQQTTLVGKCRRWWGVYLDLMLIRWANIRNEWYFHVIIGPLIPFAMLVALRLLGAVNDPQTAFYVAAGNGILALINGPMQSLANDLAWGRQRGDLEYYAALPFSKTQLVLAFVTVTSIFAIPSMLVALLVGSWWLNYTISITLWTLPIMILASLSMAGLGVFIGVNARNGHHANMMNSLMLVAVMFFSPVLIPYESLPSVLRYTAKLFPSSYAADGFRASLQGGSGIAVWGNALVLLAFSVGLIWFATKKLDWRAE